MTEEQVALVEATMLCVSEGRERAQAAARAFAESVGDPALVEAFASVEGQLVEIHRQLLAATAFPAATAGQLKLAS
ncbi:MAG: hypothetical protein ACRDNM_14550 [Gaiellaceae bacterium]